MASDQSSFDVANLFRVDGLVAVITGGGTGIGLSIAKALALNGAAKVYIIGRRLEKLQEAAAASPHGNIIALQGDVTSKDDLAAIVARITSEVGYINLLVCNSGIGGPNLLPILHKDTSIAELKEYIWTNWTQEGFSKTFEVNVTAVFFTAIAFIELLDLGNKKKNYEDVSSQIIVTSSIAAYLRQVVTGFAYPTSKAAVDHMSKSLSTYLIPYGIRVNTLNPGSFSTELTEKLIGKVDGFSPESLPGKRLGNDQDLAGTTLYLCSKAGAYLNGLALVIDGGSLSVRPSSY
ncbi:hypothetical protein V500_02215 [Pseudogymnoascus sp. VKM F-4518 (FW-2643)]|nr:hypothetical protein V500_02215 [Pseudogymnoascus sp. VKM F-4518 (FW-2643)]